MAAGLGFKTFTTGEVLTAADVNGYLMQGILVFATEAARNSAITSPQEGQFAFTKDNNSLWYYTGSAWVASGATGDIEGVTAGVGISGGGTSGTVTITNDMATTITASGDIVVGTGSGTYDNLPIGSTGQVLTADTTVSPYKVKWSTPAAGASFVGCSVYATSTTSLTSGTQTAIVYNAEHFDTDAIHDNSTNNTRFTIPAGKSGKWSFTFRTYFSTNSTGSRYLLPRKNGTNIKAAETMASSAGAFTLEINFILDLVATDYIENFVLQTSGSTLTAQSDTVYTEASCFYLGA